MKTLSIGCIGCGKMGSAIMSGVLNNPAVDKVIVTDKHHETARTFAQAHAQKVLAAQSNTEAAEADVIFIAVKPAYVKEVLHEVCNKLTDEKIIISMAAGVTLAQLHEYIGLERNPAIIRIMPNLPALIGESMTGVCSRNVPQESVALALDLLNSCGKAEEVPESLMDGVTAISGSGPAYVFMFIEALADAAVRFGIPRKQAYIYAAQTVKGSAQMVLQTGTSPAVLKDDVCSPAGTTIEGVAALEKAGLRDAVIQGAVAAYNKSAAMSK